MHNIYKKIAEYNLDKKQKILIVFDNVITDMHSSKKVIQLPLNYLLKVQK